MKLRKDDLVMVIAGAARGRKARVVKALPANSRVLLDPVEEGEGPISPAKRHLRPKASPDHPEGGIVTREVPVHVSNVMLLDRWMARQDRRTKKA